MYQRKKLGYSHYGELTDRTSVAMEYLIQALGSHPVLEEDRKLKKLYLQAEDALLNLYEQANKKLG
jgi:hypothetical protein